MSLSLVAKFNGLVCGRLPEQGAKRSIEIVSLLSLLSYDNLVAMLL